ncbi:hypothetical protein ABG067_002084 [Albugo candida]
MEFSFILYGIASAWILFVLILLHPRCRKIVLLAVTYVVLTVWYHYRHWSRTRAKTCRSESERNAVGIKEYKTKEAEQCEPHVHATDTKGEVDSENRDLQEKAAGRRVKAASIKSTGDNKKKLKHFGLFHRGSKKLQAEMSKDVSDVGNEEEQEYSEDENASQVSSVGSRRTYSGRKKPLSWGN